MKIFTICLSALLLLASGYPALAKVTKRTYSGSYKGMACTVEMTWQNWDGLGPINGVIKLADGSTVSFAGSNSSPGVIEFKANGSSFRLVRRDAGRTTTWVSSKFSFSEAAPAPTPTPTPSPTPTPTPPMATDTATQRQYQGTYQGEACTVDLVWHDGKVTGTLALASGKKIPLSGEDPGDGALKLRIDGDTRAHTLKLGTRGGGAPSFAGDHLAFTEVAGSATTVAVAAPAPAAPEARMVEQSYTGSWQGKEGRARIRWAPGDDPKIIRRGRGMLTLNDGTQLSIEAWQPSADSIAFTVAPDPSGATYKTNKTTRAGKDSWESDSLILIETE